MPRWDDPRGRDRYSRHDDHLRGEHTPDRYGREARWSDEEPSRDRHAARYEQDPVGYGRRYADAGAAGYARRSFEPPPAERGPAEDPYGHGQEYGVEGHGYGASQASDPGWGLEPGDEERRRNFDLEDVGSGQSQAGYAIRSAHEHQFDPDYVRWREEQLRNHDRAYEAWRRRQHQDYDEQIRRMRERDAGERR